MVMRDDVEKPHGARLASVFFISTDGAAHTSRWTHADAEEALAWIDALPADQSNPAGHLPNSINGIITSLLKRICTTSVERETHAAIPASGTKQARSLPVAD